MRLPARSIVMRGRTAPSICGSKSWTAHAPFSSHSENDAGASSALDLAPLDLGRTLVPFVRDDEFFDELLDK